MASNAQLHALGEAPSGAGLSEIERVVDTFVAPRKTFVDILRSASWWLPFVLISVFSLAVSYSMGHQSGFDRISETQIHDSPKREEQLNQLAPEQKARQMAISTAMTKYISYSVPVFILGAYALYALILWASFNFGLGAATKYGQVLAVTMYAALPYLLLSVLSLVALWFGGNAEAYDVKNPVGTNLAYYLPDLAPWLKSMLSWFDVLRVWSLVLQVIGMAVIAKKTLAQSATVVVGLWLAMVFFSTAIAALTS